MNLQTIIVGIAILAAVGFWLTIKVANAIDEAERIGNSRDAAKEIIADEHLREQWGKKSAVTIVRKGQQMELLRKKVRP